MITLITAVPGSGKTLFAVEWIDKFNQEGRIVYQNIAGLNKALFARPDLILDAPDDWRDTPHGSVVIYDECQQPHLYPATAQRGLVGDERLTAMETHRHSGHDLIFITQAPTLVHHHVRKLCGRHIHLYRARGLQKASRYEWSHVCDSPNDRGEQQRADFAFWNFPKKYYDYYKSATIHTHKFSMPTKLKILLMILIPSLFYLFYRAQQSAFLNSQLSSDEVLVQNNDVNVVNNDISENKEEVNSILESSSKILLNELKSTHQEKDDLPFSEIPEFKQVSGCAVAKKHKKCTCYSNNGYILEMSYEQCLILSRESFAKSVIKNRHAP